jgi:chromosome segregation ATPase
MKIEIDLEQQIERLSKQIKENENELQESKYYQEFLEEKIESDKAIWSYLHDLKRDME